MGKINILLVGDVVGKPGRQAVRTLVPILRQRLRVDFCVINGENAAGGRGITRSTFQELIEGGADAVTLGDHVWDQDDVLPILDSDPRLLRPENLHRGVPGRGSALFELPNGGRVGVMNLMGRVFMPPHQDCPFAWADRMLEGWKKEGVRLILLDFHAEATSEKIAMGRYLEGRVTAVVGTHTHVQTADEQVLPGGTAYLTDLGMTGPLDSVLGREVGPVLRRFTTGLPTRLPVAKGDVRLQGLLVEVDEATGQAISTLRISESMDEDQDGEDS